MSLSLKLALNQSLYASGYGILTGSNGATVWTPALWFLTSEQGGWWEADVPNEIYARTNWLIWSEDFSNAVWQKTAATQTAAATVAPDGTTTGIRITATGAGQVVQSVTNWPSASATITLFIKPDNIIHATTQFLLRQSTMGAANHVVATVTWATMAVSGAGATIAADANGWYKLTMSATGVLTAGSTLQIWAGSYTTSGHSYYVWHPQMEASATASAYQKVTDWNTEYIAGAAAAGTHITNFVDSAGTTPVTSVEQQVGLVLDRRLGLVLGSELVSNGGFDSDIAWTKGAEWSIAAGAASKAAGASTTGIYQNIAGSPAWIKVEFDVVAISGSVSAQYTQTNDSFASTGAIFTTTGRKTCYIPKNASATGAMKVGFFTYSSAQTVTIDNVTFKELPGNHLIQPTTASKPKLYARKNLLTYSEDFTNAAWGKTALTVVANSAAASDGTITADKIVPTVANSAHQTYISASGVTLAAGQRWTGSVELKADGYGFCYVELFLGTALGLCVNLATGAITNVSGGLIAGTVEDKGNGWWRVNVTADSTAAASYLQLYVRDVAGNASGGWSGDGVKGVLVARAQLELNTVATTYQRIAGGTDYDTVGFPHVFKFDGIDDFLYTAGNVDFTATDKMTVVAGLTKLSDVAGIVAELGTAVGSNTGSFYVVSGIDASANYSTTARGNAANNAGHIAKRLDVAPDSAILTAIHDIAGDLSRIRRNGVVGTDGTVDKGTGNFGSYVLYVGRRAGTSVPFNGELSSLVVRGAQTADLTPGEEYAATKHGVTL